MTVSSSSNFETSLHVNNLKVEREGITTLQINLGKLCNQACHHCHVEAGPKRSEIMTEATMDRVIELIESSDFLSCVDITGGAPEMNPGFRKLVSAAVDKQIKVIDRCNLTILKEKGQEDTALFLSKNKVEIVASLPCYLEDNVDGQRGKGVFAKSIDALKDLNQLGYGKEGGELVLNLVYNPVGEHLPPPQDKLENDYHRYLKEQFGIVFNNLFTITNMPIKRYREMLKRRNKLSDYMSLLIDNFNPAAAGSVMCKDLISIGWDGEIYDCDFNQMLEIPLGWKKQSIFSIQSLNDISKKIAFADHCFGCTAGAGSSCGGQTV